MAKSGGVSGIAVLALFSGAVLAYSGVKGKGIGASIRALVAGQNPGDLPTSQGVNVPDSTAAADATLTNTGEHSGGVSISSVGNSHKAFFDQVLAGIGAPVTTGNELALAAVAVREGLNNRFNPLNSVIQSGNSTAFNSVGVQDYHSFANGVAGTVALLNGDHWTGVRTALQQNRGFSAVIASFQAAYTWAPGITFPTNVLQLQQALNTPTG